MPTPSGTISMLDVANQILAQKTQSKNNVDYANLEANAALGPNYDQTVKDGYAPGISFNDQEVRLLAGGTASETGAKISMEMLQNKPAFVWDVNLSLHGSSPSKSAFMVWNLTTENDTVIVDAGAGRDVATHAFTSFNGRFYTGNSFITTTFNVATGHTYTVDDGSSYVTATLRALTIDKAFLKIFDVYDNMTSKVGETLNKDYMKFTSTHNASNWPGLDTGRGNGAQWDNNGNRLNYWAYANTEWSLGVKASNGPQFGDEVQIKITTLAQEAGQTESGVGMIMHNTS